MRPFYPGEKLSARRLNELVDAANRLIGPSSNVAPKAVRIRNDSGAPVRRFETLEVVGFASEFRERSEAVAFFAERGIVLAGKRPTGAVDAFCVVATEPIPSGGYGAATLANGVAFLAEVSGLTDATACASPISDSATYFALTSGPFRIVARSDSGVCLLTPVVEAPDPFVIDYVERQPTRVDPYISNRPWVNEYTPNGLECYLCYCDLYDDKDATLGDLFAKKLKWDVTSRDWDGRLVTGLRWRDDFMEVLTPVCCGIQATILTGSIYDAEDERTLAYRKGLSNFPPIKLEFALSWNEAEDERAFFAPYRAAVNSYNDLNGDETLRCVLDHPRRRFETLDDVPDVFFRPGLRGASIPLLCPVCYVPKRSTYIFNFKTTYETDEKFRIALETRPFKFVESERYYNAERWEIEGAAPNSGTSCVAVGPGEMRFTDKSAFSDVDAQLSAPNGFEATADGATVAFSWSAASYAKSYYWRVERSDGGFVADFKTSALGANWTASESGDYVAYLASEDAVGYRSEETSVAFSVDVPEE